MSIPVIQSLNGTNPKPLERAIATSPVILRVPVPAPAPHPLVDQGEALKNNPLSPSAIEAFDSAMDRLYAKVSLSDAGRGKNIAIVVEKMDGNGDLLFGIQMVHLLKQHIPNAKITLFTQGEHVALCKKLCGTEFQDVQDFIAPIPQKRGKTNFDVILEGPGFSELHWEKFTADRDKVVLLKEYGSGPLGVHSNFSHSMGLGENEWGIVIDDKVPKITQQTREENLDALEATALKNTILNKKTSAQYLAQNDLYFGYSHAFAEGFIQTALAIDSPRNVDICLGGQEGVAEDHRLRARLLAFANQLENGVQILAEKFKHDPLLLKEAMASKSKIDKFIKSIVEKNKDILTRSRFFIFCHKEEWKKKGIDLIEVHYKDGTKETYVLNPDAKNPRHFRLIFVPPVQHIDVKRLLLASEPFTVCTGDLSFSDAISTKKVAAYEMLRHKYDFFKSMQALGSKIDPQIAAFFKAYDEGDFAKVALFVKSRDFALKFNEFSELVMQKWNVKERLLLKMKRMLTRSQSSEISAKETALVAATRQSRNATEEALGALKLQI